MNCDTNSSRESADATATVPPEIETVIEPSLPFRILATPSVFASGQMART